MLYELKRTLRRWSRRRGARALLAKRVGTGSFIDPTVQVLGVEHVRIGSNVVIGEHTWLNVNDRAAADPAIEIGDDAFLGRRNFLNAGALIRLGPFCLTGVDCHFLGSDHHHATPFVPYISTGNETHQRIVVGANCWFGASVTVLGGVEIGFGSIIGAGAVVTENVPPFSIVVGHPARVIKRFSPAAAAWLPVAEFSPEVTLPSEDEYLERLRREVPRVRQPRHAASSFFGDL
jgi:acetyltransferase-like isoleucine patch superfamily enzyme